jgi:hypothetical protein
MKAYDLDIGEEKEKKEQVREGRANLFIARSVFGR